MNMLHTSINLAVLHIIRVVWSHQEREKGFVLYVFVP